MSETTANPFAVWLSPLKEDFRQTLARFEATVKNEIEFVTADVVERDYGISKAVQKRLRDNMKLRYYKQGNKTITYRISEFNEDFAAAADFHDKVNYCDR